MVGQLVNNNYLVIFKIHVKELLPTRNSST